MAEDCEEAETCEVQKKQRNRETEEMYEELEGGS